MFVLGAGRKLRYPLGVWIMSSMRKEKGTTVVEHLRVCGGVHVHMCTCVWRLEVDIGYFPQSLPAWVFETELLTEPGVLHDQLDGCQASSRDLLSLLYQRWDFRYMLLSLDIFKWGRDLNSGPLVLAQKALHGWNHPPSPTSVYSHS